MKRLSVNINYFHHFFRIFRHIRDDASIFFILSVNSELVFESFINYIDIRIVLLEI